MPNTEEITYLIGLKIIQDSLVRIASKTGVPGNTLASTDLDWESDTNLSSHAPVFGIIKYNSGTLGICAVVLKADTVALSASTALSTLTTSTTCILPILPGIISNDGTKKMVITVGTASLAASTFDIIVYGVSLT